MASVNPLRRIDTQFVLNVCLTGMVATRRDNENVPITSEEIARDAEACAALGGSMFHVHVRDPAGRPDWRVERFSEVLSAVRSRCPDSVLCVTTSGRAVSEFERRSASLDATPAPDMASLTLGSVDFPQGTTVNEPFMIEQLAGAMYERGILPELEIFDIRMARYARELMEREVLQPPFYANILLGGSSGAGCDPLTLAAIVKELPEETIWCVAGIGRAQLPANAMGLLFGHGIRVGLEDNLRLGREYMATNPALVERSVELARLLGRSPLPTGSVRRALGLREAAVN